MFGGVAWMLNGNVVCRVRKDNVLVRLGNGSDAWAVKLPGGTPVTRGGRRTHGLVEVNLEVF